MNMDYPTIVNSVIAIFAGAGLFFNWWAIKEENKTRQLQLINDTFNRIKDTEVLLYKEYKGKSEKEKKEWDSILLNSIEHFAFLVNTQFIKNKKLVGFFNDAIIMWYEDTFAKNHSEEELNDDTQYPEFKLLYHKIKEQSLKRRIK